MGTQQILLIVLSVIIVAIAVAVGITMFNTQAQNANRQAMIADANNYAAQMLAYYKTPTSHGGGGRAFESSMDGLEIWLGFDTGTGKYSNDNGTYTLTFTDSITTKIIGIGTEKGNDREDNTMITAVLTATDVDPISMTINN